MDKFLKYIPLVKVDEAKRIVYGLVTAERLDKDNEICEYSSTKPEYEKVNAEMAKMSGGENIMPLREMHQLHAVGAGKTIDFSDDTKEIRMGFYVSEDSTWKKVMDKVLLGFSQGGRYLKRWKQDGKEYYTAQPGEISLVDNPCLPGAAIEYAKADGSIEKILPVLAKEVKYLVPDGKHLPYTGDDGKPDHRLMGAAWAALHGGYRGNKYGGPDKDKALAHLRSIYHSEGMEPPSDKAAGLLDDLEKELEFCDGSELNTRLEKISALVGDLMGKQIAKGADMNKEQIAKCAAALGITAEEFTKTYVEGDALEKGKKGLAALHAHLKKAIAHHEKGAKIHGDLANLHKAAKDHHETMADHLENCMKAHGALQDDGEAEKILKALGVEIKPLEKKEIPEGIVKAEDMTKAITDAVTAATEKLTKEFQEKLDKSLASNNGGTGGAHLALVGRDGKVIQKVSASDARNPMAVD